jgi:hypothetical protein
MELITPFIMSVQAVRCQRYVPGEMHTMVDMILQLATDNGMEHTRTTRCRIVSRKLLEFW